MILAAAIMKPMLIEFHYHPVAPWIMAIGVVLVIIYRIINPLKGSDKKNNTAADAVVFSSLAYCFAVYLLYNNDSRWVVTLIAAIIDLVVIFRFRLPNNNNNAKVSSFFSFSSCRFIGCKSDDYQKAKTKLRIQINC